MSRFIQKGGCLSILTLLMLFGFGVGLGLAEINIVGATAEMKWTEPTTNENGSPLTDLTQTWGTYATPSQGETVCEGVVPASTPTGGAGVSVVCSVPVSPGAETPITFRAYAEDDNGNISKPATLNKTVDLLRPGSPSF